MHGKGEDRIFAYVCLGAGNEQCSRLSTERMGVGMESALEIRDRQNCWWLWCHHCCGNSFVVVTLCRGNRCWSFSLKTRTGMLLCCTVLWGLGLRVPLRSEICKTVGDCECDVIMAVATTLCCSNKCWSFTFQTMTAVLLWGIPDSPLSGWVLGWRVFLRSEIGKTVGDCDVIIAVATALLWQLCAVATGVGALVWRQGQLCYCAAVFFEIWDGEFPWDQRSAKLLVTMMSSLLWQQLCCGNFVRWQQVFEL